MRCSSGWQSAAFEFKFLNTFIYAQVCTNNLRYYLEPWLKPHCPSIHAASSRSQDQCRHDADVLGGTARSGALCSAGCKTICRAGRGQGLGAEGRPAPQPHKAKMRTCWKRRSRAASFSMYFRYSARVVAPMHRSSPRPSIGLSRLPVGHGDIRCLNESLVVGAG